MNKSERHANQAAWADLELDPNMIRLPSLAQPVNLPAQRALGYSFDLSVINPSAC